MCQSQEFQVVREGAFLGSQSGRYRMLVGTAVQDDVSGMRAPVWIGVGPVSREFLWGFECGLWCIVIVLDMRISGRVLKM